jgi:hypothetical protein
MRSSGVAQASSRVPLSCVSCPCKVGRDRGTASLCSFGLVVLGLGPVSLRWWFVGGLRGDPCLVGLGDGAVVFGHQGLIWVCGPPGGWWLTWGCCACRGYVPSCTRASPCSGAGFRITSPGEVL